MAEIVSENSSLGRRKEKKQKTEYEAQMTIYLTLVLAVIIPLLFTAIEAARVNASRVYLECVMEMGMDSVLAEYHRELLKQYGLLLLDTSYGETHGSLEQTGEHLREYMEYNLNPKKKLLLFGSRDMYRFGIKQLDFLSASRATDEDGRVFAYMAESYMLQNYGISYVEKAVKNIRSAEETHLFDKNIIRENEAAQSKIHAVRLPEQEEGSEWKEVTVENPTEGLNEFRRQGLLPFVCDKPVSGRTITPSLYASHRNLVEGNGRWSQWEERNTLEQQILLNEYYLLKTANYCQPQTDCVLQYQTEYILGGKANDTENLKAVVNKLLLIRGASNALYFSTDEALQAQAEAAAQLLSCVVLVPELEEVFEAAIIAGWILAESMDDVRFLMNGQRVPLLKEKGDWKLTLESALNLPNASRKPCAGTEKGLSYEDYLRMLLYLTGEKEKTFRMMDLIEMEIRKSTGAENFCMDNCIAAFEVQTVITSGYGYEFLLKRQAGYR